MKAVCDTQTANRRPLRKTNNKSWFEEADFQSLYNKLCVQIVRRGSASVLRVMLNLHASLVATEQDHAARLYYGLRAGRIPTQRCAGGSTLSSASCGCLTVPVFSRPFIHQGSVVKPRTRRTAHTSIAVELVPLAGKRCYGAWLLQAKALDKLLAATGDSVSRALGELSCASHRISHLCPDQSFLVRCCAVTVMCEINQTYIASQIL